MINTLALYDIIFILRRGIKLESEINKLFEYYDNVFFEEKVEVDQRGYMGTHYDGLNLDLEKVIRTFVFNVGEDRLKIFRQSVRDSLNPSQG